MCECSILSEVRPISTRHTGREIQFDQDLLHCSINSVAKIRLITEPVDDVTQLCCNLREHHNLLLRIQATGESLYVAFPH